MTEFFNTKTHQRFWLRLFILRKHLSLTTQGIIISFLPLYFSPAAFLPERGGGLDKDERGEWRLVCNTACTSTCSLCCVPTSVTHIIQNNREEEAQQASDYPSQRCLLPVGHSKAFIPCFVVTCKPNIQQVFRKRNHTFHEKLISSVILLAFFSLSSFFFFFYLCSLHITSG